MVYMAMKLVRLCFISVLNMLLKDLFPVKGNCSFENRLLQGGHSLRAIIKILS